jgi:biopolymer transport protein ExbD
MKSSSGEDERRAAAPSINIVLLVDVAIVS